MKKLKGEILQDAKVVWRNNRPSVVFNLLAHDLPGSRAEIRQAFNSQEKAMLYAIGLRRGMTVCVNPCAIEVQAQAIVINPM